MLPTLQTQRLILQPLQPTNADDLFAIYSNDNAMRFMPTPPHTAVQQTRDTITYEIGLKGAAHWAIRLINQRQVIGQVNFLGETRLPGLGYILHPDFWGHGITAEACRAVLTYGFSTLAYDRVELWIDEGNTASHRVAQKLGFRAKGSIPMRYPHRHEPHLMLVWGILATEWETTEQTAALPPQPTRFWGMNPVFKVHDVQKTVEFYRDILGFEIDFLYGDPPTHAGVSRGEWSSDLVALQLSQIPTDHNITPSSYLHIRVDATLDTLYETYRMRGVEILQSPEDKPWGLREFSIKDLNGYVLIFAM